MLGERDLPISKRVLLQSVVLRVCCASIFVSMGNMQKHVVKHVENQEDLQRLKS